MPKRKNSLGNVINLSQLNMSKCQKRHFRLELHEDRSTAFVSAGCCTFCRPGQAGNPPSECITVCSHFTLSPHFALIYLKAFMYLGTCTRDVC